MKDSTDKNNELDQYGVWVKTPAHKAADSSDESLPDFSFIDTPSDTKAPEKAPFETDDTSLTADELSKISGSIEEKNSESTPASSGDEEISLDSFITGGFSDDTPSSSSAPTAASTDSPAASSVPDGDINLDSFLGSAPDSSSSSDVSLD